MLLVRNADHNNITCIDMNILQSLKKYGNTICTCATFINTSVNDYHINHVACGEQCW